ncbi:transglycosylase SLT domain-containing protein, partial [Pseudomonas aeruginosa]
RIEKLDASMAVEDVMEMVQAGILGFTVVEQPIAERWAKVLPKLRVDRHLVLDNRADMAWYVRRDASTLRATIDRVLADYRAQPAIDAPATPERVLWGVEQMRRLKAAQAQAADAAVEPA